MKAIGFSGHRNKLADEVDIEAIACEFPGATWIHGGADGFDAQVQEVAERLNITTVIIRPDYARHEARRAPLVRNRDILRCVELLVACYDGRSSGGTAYTVTLARKMAIEVRLLKPKE